MTLFVLALDAVDGALVDRFDQDAYRLQTTERIETYAHSREQPFTPEVWATVATGLGPTEHGVTKSGTSEWDNPFLQFASRFTARLPEDVRGSLGRLARRTTGAEDSVGSTDRETMFDREGAVVRNWPGVTDGRDLQRAWRLMRDFSGGDGATSRRDFERELLGLCGEQFGWLREMTNHDVSIAATHVHTIDAAGHAYCTDEAAYERIYERVAEYVAELRDAIGDDDELLVVSDHGITVSFHADDDDGDEPGHHSWRAYASATTEDCPTSVYDIVDWVDRHYVPPSADEEGDVDIPVDQLRELGYVE